MNWRASSVIVVLMSLSTAVLSADGREEERQLKGMDVVGNRELPKALYIVPWQSAELGESMPSPFNGVFGQALSPLDPEVFRRELDYERALQD